MHVDVEGFSTKLDHGSVTCRFPLFSTTHHLSDMLEVEVLSTKLLPFILLMLFSTPF